MNDLQKQLKDMVSVYISNDKELSEEKIENVINATKALPMFIGLSPEEISEVNATLKSEHSIKLDVGSLIEERGHEKWFLSKKANLDMYYWERYRKYLLSDKGFSVNVVNKMDDILDTLTDLLGDPSREISYKRRGLVIGDVQSGKTANYTGLICKAADAGYKVIVLLTGTIERLRQQTQQRIDEGFVGYSSDAVIRKIETPIIGAGKYNSLICPMVLTSTKDDFKSNNATNLGFKLNNINGSVIFVIKKNSSVLKRLNGWLKTFNQKEDEQIDNTILVIDDEADNASVNTRNPEETPTAINGQIRLLLKAFTKSSYVGFTATPFANIFIDPESKNDMVSEDLFPKDYIYSLNSPSNYTGARDIFGEDGKASGMVRTINVDPTDPESIASILPVVHKSIACISQLPEDLKEAIEAFAIANTIEDLRGMKGTHRSMLINISRFTAVQEQVADLVNDYLKEIQEACRNYSGLSPLKALLDPHIKRLEQVFSKIYSDSKYSWEEIQKQLANSIVPIMVQTFNTKAGQNVNYADYVDGLRIIAVGGMSLSRGLTLEGLVISYFYRNSKMYDTLMQMGRWFGYREGYSDLCKIWMTEESIEWYRHISQATDELREEVKRYEDTGLTPLDFGLRVRSDITSLLVTARNKMRSTESRECVISLSGVCIETPEIYSSQEKNKHNQEITERFLNVQVEKTVVQKIPRKETNHFVLKDVSKQDVIELIENLEISPKNEQFNSQSIVNFLRDYRGKELEKWDVSIASGNSSEKMFVPGEYTCPERRFSLINDEKILKIGGSKRRLGNISDGRYGLSEESIKLIENRVEQMERGVSQRDYFINIDRNPLLTIYPIVLKGIYEPKESSEEFLIRERERARDYIGRVVYGYGIGFPTLSNHETKYARYILNKVAIQQIFEGEFDQEDEEANEED